MYEAVIYLRQSKVLEERMDGEGKVLEGRVKETMRRDRRAG